MTANAHESNARIACYRQHVVDLARGFDVVIFWLDPNKPEGAAAGYVKGTQRKCVAIAPVRDETTYAVDLHELGHCLSPLGMLNDQGSKQMRLTNQFSTIRDVRLLMMSERAAWEWAHHYALDWTPAMTQVEHWSIAEYERQLKRIIGKDFK